MTLRERIKAAFDLTETALDEKRDDDAHEHAHELRALVVEAYDTRGARPVEWTSGARKWAPSSNRRRVNRSD